MVGRGAGAETRGANPGVGRGHLDVSWLHCALGGFVNYVPVVAAGFEGEGDSVGVVFRFGGWFGDSRTVWGAYVG